MGSLSFIFSYSSCRVKCGLQCGLQWLKKKGPHQSLVFSLFWGQSFCFPFSEPSLPQLFGKAFSNMTNMTLARGTDPINDQMLIVCHGHATEDPNAKWWSGGIYIFCWSAICPHFLGTRSFKAGNKIEDKGPEAPKMLCQISQTNADLFRLNALTARRLVATSQKRMQIGKVSLNTKKKQREIQTKFKKKQKMLSKTKKSSPTSWCFQFVLDITCPFSI